MKVWSASPYFGERDVAEIKIKEQWPAVDYFVFAEGDRDHQGRPRSSVGVGDWAKQVRYAEVEVPFDDEPWVMEGHHRALLLDQMPDLAEDDIVIVSDLDEILSAAFIRRIAQMEWTLPAQFAFPIYPYRLDWRWTLAIEPGWCRCTAATGAQVLASGTDGVVKGDKFTTVVDKHAGWHFTYQGTPEQITLKARSIADGWTAGVTLADAQRAIDTGEDLFGRERPVEPVRLEELPVYVQQNPARFRHLLRGGGHGEEEEGRAGEAPGGTGA